VHPSGHGIGEPLVELDPEVVLGVRRGLLLDLGVGGHVGPDPLQVEPVRLRQVGPEPFVQPGDQLGERRVEREEFRTWLKRFVSRYGFLSQILPMADTTMEKRYAYCRLLARCAART
jgi:hypothetical protein